MVTFRRVAAVKHALESAMNRGLAHIHAHVALQSVTHVVGGQTTVLVYVLLDLRHDLDGHLDCRWLHAAALLGRSCCAQDRSSCGVVGDVCGVCGFTPVLSSMKARTTHCFSRSCWRFLVVGGCVCIASCWVRVVAVAASLIVRERVRDSVRAAMSFGSKPFVLARIFRV